jgi:RHS repeat-associated protein
MCRIIVLSGKHVKGLVGSVLLLRQPRFPFFGRRIQKSGPLCVTNYLYDGKSLGSNVIEETDVSGNVLARYSQFPSLDQPLAELRSGVTSFYEQDAIGSISALSNAVGALTNTYDYDSFGKPKASTGNIANPFQYTGRDYDSEDSISYYRARYYDPAVGRFISEDPRMFRADVNFYRYVSNNHPTWSIRGDWRQQVRTSWFQTLWRL